MYKLQYKVFNQRNIVTFDGSVVEWFDDKGGPSIRIPIEFVVGAVIEEKKHMIEFVFDAGRKPKRRAPVSDDQRAAAEELTNAINEAVMKHGGAT